MALDPIALAFQNAPVQYVLSPSIYVLGIAGRGTPVRIPPSAFGSTAVAVPGTGTVTSVGLTAPSDFSVSGSPVSTSGDLGFTWNAVAPNLIFAGPASGGAATPTFRAIVPADLAGTPAAGKYWDGAGVWTTLPPAGTGTVTSVDVAVPAGLSSTGGPITGAGTITLAWNVESANLFFAGPGSGPAGTPSFRAIVWADVSSLAGTSGTSFAVGNDTRFPASVTGIRKSAGAGSTDVAAVAADVTGLYSGTPTGAKFLRDDGTLAVPPGTGGTIAVADLLSGVGGNAVAATLANILNTIGNQSANLILAGPVSGGAATTAFRALVFADISALAGTSATSFAVGNDTRFPASVTGIRKGAGAGSTDTAAVAADVTGLYSGTPTGAKFLRDDGTLAVPPGSTSGTVTSVGLALPAIFTISGSPVTGAGTLTGTLATQNANLGFLGPASGAAAAPTFRAIVPLDLATGGTINNFFRGDGAYAIPTGTGVGFTAGRDQDRPAAAGANFYNATDTHQLYMSDQTNWANVATGVDKSTFDQVISPGGFTDIIHLVGPAIAGGGPPFGAANSMAILFHVVSLPGTSNTCLACYAQSGVGTAGWNILTSTVNSNKMTLLLGGVNGSALIQLTGNAALTTGPHILAFALNGTTVSYCLDGATVTTTAALGGTYAAPASAAAVFIGRFTAGGFPATWMRFGGIITYASALSNADLQTLSGAPSTYRFSAVTANPDYFWMNTWYRLEGISNNVSLLNWRGSSSSKTTYLVPQGVALSRITY